MDRSENMRAIRGRDTQPEIAVRRLVYGLGFRYRLYQTGLPGKPDLVFPSRKKVIFVHGCFWHCHGCKKGLIPNTNKEFWLPKLRKNTLRDTQNLHDLAELGWSPLIIWQCELKEAALLRRKIELFLGRRPRRKRI